MEKLNQYIKRHMFGFPYEAANMMNPGMKTPLETLNRVFLFGSGLIYGAKITQSSTDAPAATSGTEINASDYNSEIEFELSRVTTGSYKLSISGLASDSDARKVNVLFTTWENPLKVTAIAFTDGVMEISFATIAGTDVFSANMLVFYIN